MVQLLTRGRLSALQINERGVDRSMTDGIPARFVDMHTHLFPSPDWDLRGLDPSRAGPRTVTDFDKFRTANGITEGACMLYVPTGRIYREALDTLGSDLTGKARTEAAARIAIDRMRSFNSWGLEVARTRPDLDFFVWVDVLRLGAEEALSDLDRLAAAGAAGYKIVPKDLPIRLDDRRLWPLFDYCQAHDLPVMTAALGEKPHNVGGEVSDWMHPVHAMGPLRQFPSLKLCIAHLGLQAEDTMLELAKFPNCFGDISERLDYVRNEPDELARLTQFVRAFGVERVMFGSNFGSNLLEVHQAAVDKFRYMPLRDGERERLAYGTWDEYRRPRPDNPR